jgi:hypothetical protein
MDLSPMFGSFQSFKKDVIEMQCWPEHFHLNGWNARHAPKIRTCSGKEICFVPPITGNLSFEQKYESKIYLTGQVQTRPKNWHDFFNAMVWQIFPRAKSVLNQLHYQAQLFASLNDVQHRGALRDAATLFDESGVVVISCDKTLLKLLKNFAWKELFWQQRERVLSSMRFYVFGHGLYEKALNPYVGMTAKGILLVVKEAFFSLDLSQQLHSIDLMLERFLLQIFSSTADLTPIPILGYPGWSDDNNFETYYDNKRYFREPS